MKRNFKKYAFEKRVEVNNVDAFRREKQLSSFSTPSDPNEKQQELFFKGSDFPPEEES